MRLQKQKTYYVYILTNFRNTVFYIGVTNDLMRRMWEHKNKTTKDSFTAKYNLNKLVFSANFSFIYDAISFEKRIKNWHRDWKINLIKQDNPAFDDLSKDWFKDAETSSA